MFEPMRQKVYRLLRWSERYTKTDMVYLASGNFWMLLGRAVGMIAGMGLTVLFANLLSQHDFGTYKYILATAGIIGAISLSALPGAQYRAIGKGLSEVIPRTVHLGVLWSLPGSIVALAVAGYYFFMGNALLGSAIVVVALAHPMLSAYGVTKILFSATGDFKRATYFNMVRTLVPVAIIAATILLSGKILFIIIAYFFSNALVNFITYRVSLQKLGIQGKNPDPEAVQGTMRYAKHLSFLGIFQLVIGQLDTFLLWHFTGPVAVATYAIALGPAKEIRSLGEQATTLLFPKLSKKSEENAARSALSRSRQIFFIYLAVATLYALIAPYLFAIFFPKYLVAVLPSQVLAFALVFQSRSLIGLFLFTHGEILHQYRTIIPPLIIRAVLLLALIPPFGLWGVVVAILLSELASALVVMWTYRNFNKRLL